MKSKWFVVSLLAIAALAACREAAPAPEAPEITGEAILGEADLLPPECMGTVSGDEVTLLYQWTGVEEAQLLDILQPIVLSCGIVLRPESTRDQAIFDTRLQSDPPPDIVFWNITPARRYANQMVPLSDLGVHAENYPEFWQHRGSINGVWLALPVKADIKTIIWYSPAAFEANGYTVPGTWAELAALVEQMAADDLVPWSMGLESGPATGWPGSDFIQDILLVTQGPDYVLGIINGEIPYNDPGVAEAYQIYGKWASDPTYTVGGAEGTISIPFLEAIYKPFADPAEAMMVKQSGFAGAEIKARFPNLEYGVDYDFFGVPGAQGIQGGSDWMMVFSNKPAAAAVVAYLSGGAGGQKWAEAGFGLTPNTAGAAFYTDGGAFYVDPVFQKSAGILTAAQSFTPDIGDSIPGGFGAAEWEAIVSYLQGGDLQSLLDQVALAQAEALGDD